jgi:tetratricopeptide (TPR) repeat protein
MALVVGCANQSKATQASKFDARRSAAENLDRLAASEPSATGKALVPAIPPDVEPAALQPHPADAPRARMSVDEALTDVLSTVSLPEPVAPALPAVDEASRAMAVRHYLKGRDAATRNHVYVTVTELQKAAELDPTSPEILRELARAYRDVNNSVRSAVMYERWLSLEPGNPEASLALALTAGNRRSFDISAALLARAQRDGVSFDHDPAAQLLADYTLAFALRQLGYDRAFIELSSRLALPDHLEQPTMYAGQLGAVFRQQGEILRNIGDAHCRLSDYHSALAAYESAAALPAADPASLTARIVFVHLHLGRPYAAQRAMLEILRAREAVVSPISERDIGLCNYVRSNVPDATLLAQAAADLYRAHPDDPGYARAAAALLPPAEAAGVLREFIGRQPRDLDAVGQLVLWLADRDQAAAVTLVASLIADHPDLADDYARQLAAAPAPAKRLLDAVEILPDSPGKVVLQAHLLESIGAIGESWSLCQAGLQRWPEDALLHRLQIQIAALLEEPAMLERAIAAAQPYRDARMLTLQAQAWRVLGMFEQARRAADEALSLDSQQVEAMIELARSQASLAAAIDDPPQREGVAKQAVATAERAISIEPDCEPAFEILLSLHGATGPLADSLAVRSLGRRLTEAKPESRLVARLAAEEFYARGRYEDVVERSLALYSSDPTDHSPAALAVASWAALKRTDDAERWLDEQLAIRPGNAELLEQLVRLQVDQGKLDDAAARLERVIEDEPRHALAMMLLEEVYRRQQRNEEAFRLAERRLMALPEGPRRELGLAEAYADWNLDDESVRHLQWVVDHGDEATFRVLTSAMRIAGRLAERNPAHHGVMLALAERTLARYPQSPLQVYGLALRSMSALGESEGRMRAVADDAARHAHGGRGPTQADVEAWRQLAQSLLDADAPVAAALGLRARLECGAPLEPDAATILSAAAIGADLASGNRAREAMSFVEQLFNDGRLDKIPAFESVSTLAEALHELSQLCSIIGDDASAEQMLRRVIGLNPDDAMSLNNLGYMRIEQGYDDPQSIETIERAFALMPGDDNILDTIGWLRYMQGRFDGEDGALGHIEAAVSSVGAPGAEVLDHHGDVLWRLGRTDKALESWRKAVEHIDATYPRDNYVRAIATFQMNTFALTIKDPEVIYDAQFGDLQRLVQEKIVAAEAGANPPVAPTFAELNTPESIRRGNVENAEDEHSTIETQEPQRR